jgi:hypothetical protein
MMTETHTSSRNREVYIRAIPASYSWRSHIFWTFATGIALMLLPLAFVHEWHWKLVLGILAVWLVVSPTIEYCAHRWLLHRLWRLVPRKIYEDHDVIHHTVYDGRDDLAFENPKELKLILMPPWAIAAFSLIFVILTPLAWWAFGRDQAMVATAAGIAYIVWYEFRHMMIHWPISQDRLSKWLLYNLIHWERTHWRHHQTDKTRHFSVVFPLVDWGIAVLHWAIDLYRSKRPSPS